MMVSYPSAYVVNSSTRRSLSDPPIYPWTIAKKDPIHRPNRLGTLPKPIGYELSINREQNLLSRRSLSKSAPTDQRRPQNKPELNGPPGLSQNNQAFEWKESQKSLVKTKQEPNPKAKSTNHVPVIKRQSKTTVKTNRHNNHNQKSVWIEVGTGRRRSKLINSTKSPGRQRRRKKRGRKRINKSN